MSRPGGLDASDRRVLRRRRGAQEPFNDRRCHPSGAFTKESQNLALGVTLNQPFALTGDAIGIYNACQQFETGIRSLEPEEEEISRQPSQFDALKPGPQIQLPR